MCGRFGLTVYERDKLKESLDLHSLNGLYQFDAPLYNIAPTQIAPVVVEVQRWREVRMYRWGLTPSWWKEKRPGPINARAETVATNRMFSSAFRERRCLIPATGFYEWRHAEGKGKQPHWITMADGELFAFAGLWERHSAGDTFAIITTEPNELVSPNHDGMPVIIPRSGYTGWLSGDEPEKLLRPYPADEMRAVRVSTYVNSPSNTGAECVEAVA